MAHVLVRLLYGIMAVLWPGYAHRTPTHAEVDMHCIIMLYTFCPCPRHERRCTKLELVDDARVPQGSGLRAQ